MVLAGEYVVLARKKRVLAGENGVLGGVYRGFVSRYSIGSWGEKARQDGAVPEVGGQKSSGQTIWRTKRDIWQQGCYGREDV